MDTFVSFLTYINYIGLKVHDSFGIVSITISDITSTLNYVHEQLSTNVLANVWILGHVQAIGGI